MSSDEASGFELKEARRREFRRLEIQLVSSETHPP
jgi:hypothetical protein